MRISIFVFISLVTLSSAPAVFAHCEVPCGIYDDEMRFEMIAEHITTIEKSMKQISELSTAAEGNYNQIVRWVSNKDHHAEELQHIVHQYFMTQRVKPVDSSQGDDYDAYLNKLRLLHGMLVSAMTAKQTTDVTHIENLRMLKDAFYVAYFGPDHKEHTH